MPFRLRRILRTLGPLVLASMTLGTGLTTASCTPARGPRSNAFATTEDVFRLAVPSVVAVLNDDQEERDQETARALREMGEEGHAPKKVFDVTENKDPMPHGTGFMIEGGLILTAAHVVQSPDRLKVTTRAGKTVDAELLKLDEVRDVAVLRPKTPLPEVPPLRLDERPVRVGSRVFALGHTGAGLWRLAWGITQGVASGNVDLAGGHLVVHDAAIYPGFSGGPLVTIDEGGVRVLGVNHAILFAGGLAPATISSGSSVEDIKKTLSGAPLPLQAKLAEFARAQARKPHAQLFITPNVAIHKDPNFLTTAAIVGNAASVTAQADDSVKVPLVAMVFGLAPGEHEVDLVLEDSNEKTVATAQKTLTVERHERIAITSTELRATTKSGGRFEVVVKARGQELGRTHVWVQDPNDDAQPVAEEGAQDDDSEDPHVDVVVASAGAEDPLRLQGIRAAWSEWRYPRRVAFTWFARGSRGWSGTNVAVSSFVLDDKGTIVGRGIGCVRPQLRPEQSWSCMGSGGTPLLGTAGRYDVVFTVGDRPVAVWPMEALVRGEGSLMSRWMDELRKSRERKSPRKSPGAPQ